MHPQCAVALRITFAAADEGQRKLTLNFINADGRSIMPAMEIPVPVALPEDVHFVTRNFIVNIQQLKFAEAGLYSVDVLLDGQSQASIPLPVKLMHSPRRRETHDAGVGVTRLKCDPISRRKAGDSSRRLRQYHFGL